MATTQRPMTFIYSFIHSFILSSINSFIKESLICLFINAFNIICRRPFLKGLFYSLKYLGHGPVPVPKMFQKSGKK